MARGPKFHVYKAADGDYRWTLKTANGRIVAASGEGYGRKKDALEAVAKIQAAATAATIVVLDEPTIG
jgi:uncharacterized protein YegP (UPF0339 family)